MTVSLCVCLPLALSLWVVVVLALWPLSLSRVGFLKSEALRSACQSARPATQLQCQSCRLGALSGGTKTLHQLLHLLSPNLNANVIILCFDGTN